MALTWAPDVGEWRELLATVGQALPQPTDPQGHPILMPPRPAFLLQLL